MGRAFSFLAFCVVALAPGLAFAQVNTDTLRPGPVKPGFGGGLDASVMKLGGNVELLDVAFGGRIETRTFFPPRAGEPKDPSPYQKQAVLLMGNFHYTARGGSAFLNQGILHGRFTYFWNRYLGSRFFVQHQFNEFQRLRVRSVWGASVAFPFLHHPVVNASFGSGYIYEYNRISPFRGATDPLQTFEHRWSNYFGVRLNAFGGQLLMQSTTYFQPRFDKFSDFRLLQEVEALARVGEIFGFGATFSLLYDSAPPTGVKKMDTRISTNVRVSF